MSSEEPDRRATIVVTSRGGGPALARICALIRAERLERGTQVLLVSPSPGAAREAAEHDGGPLHIDHVADHNLGRTLALNAALAKATGRIVVVLSDHAVPTSGAIARVVGAFADPAVGAACGRPVAEGGVDDLLHFWQEVLLDAAHRTREQGTQERRVYPLAGELFAFRRRLVERPIPTDCPYPDMYITQLAGPRLAYIPDATVRVAAAPHLGWWLEEKIHSLAASQRDFRLGPQRVRRFRLEASGVFSLLRHGRSARKLVWLFLLVLARSAAWVGAWFASRLARAWVADGARRRDPIRVARVGDVYEMRLADLGFFDVGTCEVVVRQVVGDNQLRVVARLGPATREWSAIPSRAEGRTFPGPGSFMPLTHLVDVAQLGSYRGRCPNAQWRNVRKVT